MATRNPSRPKLSFIASLILRAAFKPMEGTQQVPIPVVENEIGITFIGHSSFLIQIGGLNLLVDPVFASWIVVMHRLRRPGVAIKNLPPIDAVLLSHAHMDHLNLPSLRKIIRHTRRISGKAPEVIVPWGVSDLVDDLGFSKVHSLEWWQSLRLPAPKNYVEITLTPAKHWGARRVTDTYRGYGGFVLRQGSSTLYHSGDTGYFDGFKEIGKRLTPQIALLPIGAYSPDGFRSVHTSPEDALQGFIDLNASVMVPMHYGTFCLSAEPMNEPLPRLLAAAGKAGLGSHILPLTEGETKIFPTSSTASEVRSSSVATELA